ncbi:MULTISPECIES: hypothetical protein [unclassified Pseudomonas]|uniref:hypothetical protein n=1 Tax=unclassified Pseudomonas TaxID=196821 RepID=UPI001390F16C|nr:MULTISPECIES: hypothetical protein [unclassified Pseudomonas]KAI2693505.1 hypothetical protein GBC55_004920 [Pseudomonas sp. TNT3]MBF4559591.1 hypothetical protein [Pseudomonas sp. p50(2008)]MBH2032716.1 hypothetical protein [Pseudomonadales bacterium]MBH2074418.1 hypothetical protein [Pseudomonadales bacterium]
MSSKNTSSLTTIAGKPCSHRVRYLLSDTARQFGLTRYLTITSHITLHLSAL